MIYRIITAVKGQITVRPDYSNGLWNVIVMESLDRGKLNDLT